MSLIPGGLQSAMAMVRVATWNVFSLVKDVGKGEDGWRGALRRSRKGAALFLDPGTQLRVTTALSHPNVRPIVAAAPLIMFKYLTDYLSNEMSRKERATILARHYTFLGNHANERFFHAVVGGRIELWQRISGEHAYSIDLCFPREAHSEGDLALIFRGGAVDLYTLSFTLGPGSVAGLQSANVMYIARVQGKGRALDLIRNATKQCLDVSPAALLLAAAEGIALALGLERIIGISGGNQVSTHRASQPQDITKMYDAFWIDAGGHRLDRDMFQLEVPLAEKPLKLIQQRHRPRTLRKRYLKRCISAQVCATFRELALRAATVRGGINLTMISALGCIALGLTCDP